MELINETEKKRSRAPNYTYREKECLLSIISKYKNFVENKKTDAVSSKEKKDVWIKIWKEFNSSSPNLYNRNPESLKKFYDKLKEDVRKRSAQNKMNLYKTGGGEGKWIEKPGDEILLSIVQEKSVTGLYNYCDSDATKPSPEREKEREWDNNFVMAEAEQEVSEAVNDIEIIYEPPAPVKKPMSKVLQTNIQQEVSDEVNDIEIICAPPAPVKKPMSKVLQTNIQQISSQRQKLSRRRPAVINTLTSSKLGEKYELLIDKKLELLQCSKKEHYLRMHKLKLDIALKKQLLSSEHKNYGNDPKYLQTNGHETDLLDFFEKGDGDLLDDSSAII